MDSQIGSPHHNGNGNSAQGLRVSPARNGKDWKLRTVYRLAEQHCANWCRGGTCEGVDFDRTGRHFRWRESGGPCLFCLDQRCRYFEEAVLPMEKRGERDWPTVAQGVVFREAARLYRLTFSEAAAGTNDRMCPDCGKHRIAPRKRCCADCRIRRRRATKAENQRNFRKRGVERSTVNENGSSLGAASRGTDLAYRYLTPREPISGVNCTTHGLAPKEVA